MLKVTKKNHYIRKIVKLLRFWFNNLEYSLGCDESFLSLFNPLMADGKKR